MTAVSSNHTTLLPKPLPQSLLFVCVRKAKTLSAAFMKPRQSLLSFPIPSPIISPPGTLQSSHTGLLHFPCASGLLLLLFPIYHNFFLFLCWENSYFFFKYEFRGLCLSHSDCATVSPHSIIWVYMMCQRDSIPRAQQPPRFLEDLAPYESVFILLLCSLHRDVSHIPP